MARTKSKGRRAFDSFVEAVKDIPKVQHVVAYIQGQEIDVHTFIEDRDVEVCRRISEVELQIILANLDLDLDFHVWYLDGRPLHQEICPLPALVFSHTNLAEAYFYSGNANSTLGLHESAVEDYSKSLRLRHGLGEAYNNRGNAHVWLGEYEKAIQDYEKAFALKTNLEEVGHNRKFIKEILRPAVAASSQLIPLNLKYIKALS
ncbi:MAG: hypothetical protein HW403_777 [Dehalococcoidia bacterium]|nr:hypothetical protein [Dehalococcoidia bacterium]